MEKKDEYENYAIPVHQSLLEKKVLFGIGEKAFYTILLITIILASAVSIYCIGIGILAVIICQRICKNDSYLLDFLFENFNQQDIYIG